MESRADRWTGKKTTDRWTGEKTHRWTGEKTDRWTKREDSFVALKI